jgi:hypothetical protein
MEGPRDEGDVRRNEHATVAGMDLFNLYDLLDGCAKSFCKSYHENCDKCMSFGHFSFQCSIILEESLVSHTRDEVEYLVYKCFHDLLLKESIRRKSSDSTLQMKLIELLQLLQSYSYFQEQLSGNPLFVDSKVPCKTIVHEDNHL